MLVFVKKLANFRDTIIDHMLCLINVRLTSFLEIHLLGNEVNEKYKDEAKEEDWYVN